MKYNACLNYLLAATILFQPIEIFARGFGGRAGGGGGGGGGVHPGFGGGGGGGARPNIGGGGGGGSRPNLGSTANHTPSISHPTGGGSSRPNIGGGNISGGNRPNIGSGNISGGNRPNIGGGNISGGNRPNIGGGNISGGNRPNIGSGNISGGNRPNIGSGNISGGNRPNIGSGNISGGNRPNIGSGNISGGNRPNIGSGNISGGNRTNIGSGGNRTNIGSGNISNIHNTSNNFNNVHNNINIASNRPYYNNWQHGNWNGNWNHAGGGYYNGWAHGYANGYNRGYWNGGWGGYWHGGWGGYWGAPWYAAPIAWGLGAWAVGSIAYNSGYMAYSNPYYASGGGTSAYYDYSQPITVINQQPATAQADATQAGSAPTPEIQEGTSHTDLAREAFKNSDYATAMNETDAAIKALPKDAALHEFRALVLFATKDYKQAAATLYAVLSAGPGWDWTTLSGMYANVSTYTDQLRDLEQYVKANPSAADARFVLGYHYLTCGHSDAAAKQYQDVLKLQPSNQLATQLLKLVSDDPNATTDSTASAASQPSPEPPSTDNSSNQPQPQAPQSIDPKAVVGNWTAKREDGSTFALNITDDGKFTWGFSQGNNKQNFDGQYKVDGAILVLERGDGSQMPGLITMADKGFNFKMYGGPPDDPGLNFQK